MSTDLRMFEVEAIEPRKPRARKSLVRRWLVMAESAEQAIDRAIDAQITAILGTKISADTRNGAAEIQRGDTWTANVVEGYVFGRPSVIR